MNFMRFSVALLLTMLLGANFLAAFLQVELWPFSRYPMYSKLNTDVGPLLVLGIPCEVSEISEFEVPIKTLLYPLDPLSLNESMSKIIEEGDANKLRNALLKLEHLYTERQRWQPEKFLKVQGLKLVRLRPRKNLSSIQTSGMNVVSGNSIFDELVRTAQNNRNSCQ